MASSKTVDIKDKPSGKVSSLAAPSMRSSGSKLVYSTSWKYAKQLFSESKSNRFSGVVAYWEITLGDVPLSKKTTKTKTQIYKVSHKGYKGSNTKTASTSVDRTKFYPCNEASYTMVKTYKVVKAAYSRGKWKLTKIKRSGGIKLSALNAAEKNRTLYSQVALTKFSKTKSPKGKLFYKKKTGAEIYKQNVKYKYAYDVNVYVQGWNTKTASSNGKPPTAKTAVWDGKVPYAVASRKFSEPPVPKISHSVAGEASSHTITFDVTGDDGKESIFKERYDSLYTLRKTVGFLDNGKVKSSTEVIGTANTSTTKKTFQVKRNPSIDMPSGRTILGLQPNEYITYQLTVRNRGFAGDSNDVSNSFTYACPDDVSVTSIVMQGQHYTITFNKATEEAGVEEAGVRYTTKYTLQRLSNYRPSGGGSDSPVDDWSDIKWRDAAANDPSWTDVYTIGSGELRNGIGTFSDFVANAYAEPFRRTYYRILAQNDIYGMPGRQSLPFVVPGYLSIPSARNQTLDIVSLSSTQDGKAIMAVVAFDKKKTTDGYYLSNGTEMSWDTADYAWSSTQPATSYDFKDETVAPILVTQTLKEDPTVGKYLANVSLNWVFATYYLRGVNASEKYYVKGRRFLKDTETRESASYGDYAEYSTTDSSGNLAVGTIEVKASPKDVKLSVPKRLVHGKDLAVSWTYDSEDVQTAYELMWLRGTGDNAKSVAETLLSEKDSAPYAVIRWNDLTDKIFENSVYLAVKVGIENDWSDLSDVQTIKIVSPPRASLNPISTVDALPFTVTLGTSDSNASAIVRIVAEQYTGWGPEGPYNQAEGTIVHTNKLLHPSWEEMELEDGTIWYYYNYSIGNVDLRDNGRYTLEYTAVVDDTGLDSNTVDAQGNIVKQTATFSVDYPEDLIVPPFYVVVDPIAFEHDSAARISIMDVAGDDDCVVDLYRVTPTNAQPVILGLENWRNVTITDKYPAYSRRVPCLYRLAVRSSNGVREWSDRSYALPGYSVRFDWGDQANEAHGQYTHLVIPYNLRWSDSWTKNSRIDLHMDGEYSGFWRDGVQRKNTLNTDIVKMTGSEQIARVMALAKYAGPVLVRLPNGCVFAADVQVSNLDVSYENLTIAASFNATEIRMPTAYTTESTEVVEGLYRPQA